MRTGNPPFNWRSRAKRRVPAISTAFATGGAEFKETEGGETALQDGSSLRTLESGPASCCCCAAWWTSLKLRINSAGPSLFWTSRGGGGVPPRPPHGDLRHSVLFTPAPWPRVRHGNSHQEPGWILKLRTRPKSSSPSPSTSRRDRDGDGVGAGERRGAAPAQRPRTQPDPAVVVPGPAQRRLQPGSPGWLQPGEDRCGVLLRGVQGERGRWWDDGVFHPSTVFDGWKTSGVK